MQTMKCVQPRALVLSSVQAFSCHDFDSETPALRRRYLISDVYYDCDSDEYHSRVFSTAWLAIGVYAFGLLAFNAMLLFLARKAILSNKPTPLSTALNFLYKECEKLISSAQSELIDQEC